MSTWKERIMSELELCSGSDKTNNWYNAVVDIVSAIDKYPEESCKVAIDLILKSWNWKPWSPINLNVLEFDKLNRHKRAWYIQRNNTGIYNVLAYTGIVRKAYVGTIDDKITQVEKGYIVKGDGEIIDEKIYISRGGIINGDYIHKCYLKNQIEHYYIKDPIKLPVSLIEPYNSLDFILFVDHREPKLKALMEFYNVPIEHDENVKYNVRTFKKLK